MSNTLFCNLKKEAHKKQKAESPSNEKEEETVYKKSEPINKNKKKTKKGGI